MVGLTFALRAAREGHDVTVIERDSVPGGLASCFRPFSDGDQLERFYHHIFRTDTNMIALIDELGLSSKLSWRSPSTACLYTGRLHRLDSALSLLRFAPLALHDRLRLAIALAILKLAKDGTVFERMLAAPWLRAVAGGTAYRVVFEPLFRAKFGRHAENVSLAWFWARIHDRTSELGYLEGGFSQMYERLAERVIAAGGTIHYDTAVASIDTSPETGDVALRFAGSATWNTFDRAVVTLPSAAFAALAPAATSWSRNAARRPDALGARCIVLALDRKLSKHYWINACDPNFPFMVVVEQTNFVSPENYGGRHLVYLGNYGESFEGAALTERLDSIAESLRTINPAFSRDWILDAWEFRASGAQPVVTTSYRDTLPPFATAIPGAFLANLEQVYPHDRGQNYAIDIAARAYDACLESDIASTSFRRSA
jgi:protoporphyrinogen oxidase